ncbi:MAG: CAP domain-containing protein [Symploca sp. SIO2E6]|nr:CAP domain-containing protein [Symploca sp. SIO2E6]
MPKRLSQLNWGLLVLATGLSSCNSPLSISQPLPSGTTPTPTATQRSTSGDLIKLEQSVHQQINQYRQSRNLSPLTLDPRISEQARLHSEAMASGRVPFSHDGFKGRVQALEKSLPYSSAAENVAYNQGYSDPARQAVEGWIKSPGHLKNIQGEFDLTGIGVIQNAKGEYYLTQVFLKRR